MLPKIIRLPYFEIFPFHLLWISENTGGISRERDNDDIEHIYIKWSRGPQCPSFTSTGFGAEPVISETPWQRSAYEGRGPWNGRDGPGASGGGSGTRATRPSAADRSRRRTKRPIQMIIISPEWPCRARRPPPRPATIRIGCCSCRRFSPSRATPSPPSSFLPSAPFLLPRFLAELPKQITREPAQRRSCKGPRKVALSAASIWLFFSFFFQVSIDDLILLPQERERERWIHFLSKDCVWPSNKSQFEDQGNVKKNNSGILWPQLYLRQNSDFFFSFLPEVRGKERNLSTRSTRMDRLPSVRSLYRGLLISNDLLGWPAAFRGKEKEEGRSSIE